jgi:hypothetical protein
MNLTFAGCAICLITFANARSAPRQTSNSTAPTTSARDGAHDFDFEIGTWKTHVKRLQHPLTGSTAWAEYDGTSVVRKIWNGGANLLELEVGGPAGHIEGLSLRLYNPESRQWSLHFANSSSGSLGQPTVGEFRNGRGEFFDQETFNGRAILVRFVISDVSPNSCHFEQAFSDDGGKTWEVNWIADDTRLKDEPGGVSSTPAISPTNSEKANPEAQKAGAERDGQHDFDFEVGSWNIHLNRLQKRLAGSTTWVKFDGTSVTRKVWDGRADLEEFETDDPIGHTHIEGLTLRLYNPQSRQWSIYWANGSDGILGFPPMTGEFKNGVGEFYDQEPFQGRMIYVRFLWSNTTTNTPHFEQSFSNDGGKTWEVNWITDQTKVKQ